MIALPLPENFDEWRRSARDLLYAEVSPGDAAWGAFLFSGEPPPKASGPPRSVPKEFLQLGRTLACHRDDTKWGLLYRLLWRMTHGERKLLEIEVDVDVREALLMERAVRRDMHKMKAFVRFRKTRDGHYIAWHRPDHLIVQAMAPWFVKRFGDMQWAILTPDRSAFWNQKELRFGPGVPKSQAPASDDLEDLWRLYYASVFNPARLKVDAMKKEMAVRHWATLPEAQIIPQLISEARNREQEMRGTQKTSAAPFVPQTRSLNVLTRASKDCRGCALYQFATQTVFGAGPAQAHVMMVGEQPGDQEDLQGKPFVGPAGAMLSRALEEAGIERDDVYVTNAVKHFKFEERGKRRIHKKPGGLEIAACHPWLDAEISVVQPRVIVALGATAALSLAGRDFKLTRDRGKFFPHPSSAELFATIHPSFLLRVPEPERREEEYARFVDDLRLVRERLLRAA